MRMPPITRSRAPPPARSGLPNYARSDQPSLDSHHRERGDRPASRDAQVVVARPDTAHVRGQRVGVCPLWRPRSCGSHLDAPRRHPPDSRPPGPPDRRAVAPARRLICSAGLSPAPRWALPRAHGRVRPPPGCDPRRSPVRPPTTTGSGTLGHREAPLRAPRPAHHALRRYGRAAGWRRDGRDGW